MNNFLKENLYLANFLKFKIMRFYFYGQTLRAIHNPKFIDIARKSR
jgi:hypothetical protein